MYRYFLWGYFIEPKIIMFFYLELRKHCSKSYLYNIVCMASKKTMELCLMFIQLFFIFDCGHVSSFRDSYNYAIRFLNQHNPLMPVGNYSYQFFICCPRDAVSRTANEKLVTIVANRH